ncbi:hypothetical protein ACFY1U_45410 [Streptomyces sp. NPDC001351]|uniref:hypothetical protein n=1 Tax=Streptomyces sp. NPDC001351 TaxID=3364564 RepID=UPI0036CCD2A5
MTPDENSRGMGSDPRRPHGGRCVDRGPGGQVIGGSGSGSDIEDDGPHKVTTPATLLSEYKKVQSDVFDKKNKQQVAKYGVKNAHGVNASYEARDVDHPGTLRTLQLSGAYGEKSDTADDGIDLVGSPKAYTPSELDGAVLKCQENRIKGGSVAADSSGKSKDASVPVCVWGDNSTLGVVMHVETARATLGMPVNMEYAAEQTARLRKEVRVKI